MTLRVSEAPDALAAPASEWPVLRLALTASRAPRL